MNDLQYHPAANIFPMMSEKESTALLEDIKKHGQKTPIELLGGKILDGRNRYLSCLKLGIECDYYDLEDIDDPVAYVLSANLYRRHLDTSQRAMVGARSKEVYEEQAKERQKAAGKQHGKGQTKVKEKLPEPMNAGQSRDQAGAAVKVSGKTIDHASKVINLGTRDLIKAVDSGTIPVSQAAKIAELPKAEQPKAIKEAKQPKPKRQFPHSDQFGHWLDAISGQMTVMHQRHKSVVDMLECDGWDKKQTTEYAARLRRITKSLVQYEKEFNNYVNS